MWRRGQMLLIFHGSILVILAMSMGIPEFQVALSKPITDPARQFLLQSHAVLVITGIWMIASGAALSLLGLRSRGVNTLVYSLIIAAYTFAISVALQTARLLLLHLPPAGGKYFLPYMIILIVSGAASLLGGIMMILGAWVALRQSMLNVVH
jgi:hypothetical protein